MTTYVLGIDPGVTVGFALIGCDGEDWWLEKRWEYRWEKLEPLYEEIADATCGPNYEVEQVAMERMLAYRQATADEKVEAQAIVKLACEELDKSLHLYAPGTIRSAVVGNGKATAAQIKATVRHLLDLPKVSKKGEAFTPHQQDAVCVALAYLVCDGGLRVLKQARKCSASTESEKCSAG